MAWNSRPRSRGTGAHDAWNTQQRPLKGGARPRPPSRTTSLPFQQARKLINGLAFAETLLPEETPWVHVTMVLEQSEGFDPDDPRAYLALQGHILSRVRDWLRSRRLPAHWLWVREVGPNYGHQHTHVLMPLPPDRREELEELIYRSGKFYDLDNNRAVDVNANRREENTGIRTPASRAGILRDFLKTMSPKALLDGQPIMPALIVDNRGQRPCTILGKRRGTSESLGRKARAKAGWSELETLQALRTVLPDEEEAERARNARKAKRRRERRAERASRPLSTWKPAHPIDPEAEDDGLAADFG
jgi:hypothetical protein